jgi:hypothetical protein
MRLTWLSQTKVVAIAIQRGRASFSRKLKTSLVSDQGKNLVRNEVWLMILFRLGLNFKVAIFSVQFYPFGQNLSRLSRLTQNWLLTSNKTDWGETFCTKGVGNFDTFPVSISTPLSDKLSRSNDLRKSGSAAGNSSFWTDRWNWFTLGFEPSSQRKPRTL